MKPWMIFGGVALVAAVAAVVVLNRRAPPSVVIEPMNQEKEMSWEDAQAAFMAGNLTKPGWQATASGMQYITLKAGDGTTPKPEPGSEVKVHYEGKLINGDVFDSSYARGEPISFPLNGVIRGWQEGVPMMRVGETWEFVIPADLAYGDNGVGPIPGGSALIFKIELLEAKTPAP
jgi:FKBP-type peptidyl-prolyl cis-trans isomerase